MRPDDIYPDDLSYVTDADVLRGMHLKPMSRATDKVLTELDEHCRAIIALSPFCVISSQGPDGADVSPRGDPPGFIRILDDTHLLLPDRVGNNRLDNFLNLLENPKIGMLILVPGMDETLRLNGTARITDDPRVLEASAIRDRAPKIGLVIKIEEVFLHCSKALVRSKLWGEENRIDRRSLPTYTQILTDHVAGLTLEESERQGKIMAERGLY